MRARWTTLMVLAVVPVLFACGDDDGGAASTTVSPTSTSAAATSMPTKPSPVPTTTRAPTPLEPMLLSVDDLGGLWTVGNPINDADLQDSVQVPCDAALDTAIVERLRADTGIQFDPVDGSSKLLIEFLKQGEPDQLAADVQALMDAFAACPHATWPGEGGYSSLEAVALPSLGDQQMAVRITGIDSPESEVVTRGYAAYVRVGSVLVNVGLIEMVPKDGGQATTDEQFVDIVTAAVDRVTG